MKRVLAIGLLLAFLVPATALAHYGAPYRTPNAMAWEIKRFEGGDVEKVICEGVGQSKRGRYQHFLCATLYWDNHNQVLVCNTHLTGWSYGDYSEVRCHWMNVWDL